MVLVGRLKLSHQDLFYYTLTDLEIILEGHEIDKRDDWERTRASTFIMVSPNFKKGSTIKPTELMPLPWDQKKTTVSLVDRAKEALRKLKENGRVKN